jgi:hypothetical protein
MAGCVLCVWRTWCHLGRVLVCFRLQQPSSVWIHHCICLILSYLSCCRYRHPRISAEERAFIENAILAVQSNEEVWAPDIVLML